MVKVVRQGLEHKMEEVQRGGTRWARASWLSSNLATKALVCSSSDTVCSIISRRSGPTIASSRNRRAKKGTSASAHAANIGDLDTCGRDRTAWNPSSSASKYSCSSGDQLFSLGLSDYL